MAKLVIFGLTGLAAFLILLPEWKDIRKEYTTSINLRLIFILLSLAMAGYLLVFVLLLIGIIWLL